MVGLSLQANDDDGAKHAIRRLFELQQQRVLTFNEFEIKFKEYLLDAPKFQLERLKLICKQIGDAFNEINRQIIEQVLNYLKETTAAAANDNASLIKLVESIQENEEVKFKLVMLIRKNSLHTTKRITAINIEIFLYIL